MMWCINFFMFEKPTGAHALRSAPTAYPHPGQ